MEELNERQIQILRLLTRQAALVCCNEIARQFQCSAKTIQRDFRRLKACGKTFSYCLLHKAQGSALTSPASYPDFSGFSFQEISDTGNRLIHDFMI